MFISGQDRYDIRQTMLHASGNFRGVYGLVATVTDCTACGYDTMSDSGLDPTCATCSGTGKTFAWLVQEVSARIKVFDFVQLQGAGAVPPGVELGDMALYVRKNDQALFDTIQQEHRSYVKVDGDSNAYRPFAVSSDGVGMDDEFRILMRKVTLDERKTGY